jgi:acyl carrier protein
VDQFESLQELFRTVFGDRSLNITPDMTANDVDGWDSLSHTNLITAVELKFKVRFTAKELLTLNNIGDLQRLLAAKTEGGSR